VDGRVALSYALFGLTNPDEVDTKSGVKADNKAHRSSYLQVIKLLLDNGADPQIMSNYQESPLKLAQAKCMHDAEVMKMFENKVMQKKPAEQTKGSTTSKKKPKPKEIAKNTGKVKKTKATDQSVKTEL